MKKILVLTFLSVLILCITGISTASAETTAVFPSSGPFSNFTGATFNIDNNADILNLGNWDKTGSWSWESPPGTVGYCLRPVNGDETFVELRRTIDISSQAERIDSADGHVRAELTVDIGGYGKAGDRGRAAIVAFDGNGTQLSFNYTERPQGYGNYDWGQDWETKTVSLSLPRFTRYIKVYLQGYEDDEEGIWWEGHFWNVDAFFRNIRFKVYDELDPAFRSLTTDLANGGHYGEGTNINIYARFSEPVVYHGGNIRLNIGGNTNCYADYVSGSGTNTLTFRYTVPSGTGWTDQPLAVYGWNGINIKDHPGRGYGASDSHIAGRIEGKYIYMDNTTPGITGVTSSRGDGVYKAGENIDIRISYNENVAVHQAPGVRLNTGNSTWGYASYDAASSTSNTLVFNYTVRPGDNTADLHVEALEGGNITDAAGHGADRNVGTRFRDTKEIKLDTQAPAISFVEPADRTTYKKSHSVIINASDNIAGVKQTKYSWNTSSNPASVDWGAAVEARNDTPVGCPTDTGIYYLHAMSADNVDNVSYATSGPYYFDNTAPTASISPGSGASALSHTVTVGSSDGHSGPGVIQYQWINTEKGGKTYGGPFNISNGGTTSTPSEEGAYTLHVSVWDNAGNMSTASAQSYIVDLTQPSVSFSSTGNSQPAGSRQVTVTLHDAKSNLGQSYYLWTQSVNPPAAGDEGWTVFYNGGSGSYSADISTPQGVSGTWYLHIKSDDALGNRNISTAAGGFLLDNASPALSFSQNGTFTNVRSVSTRLNITDNITSGTENFTIKYLIDKNEACDWDDGAWPVSADGVITIQDVTGKYYIHAKVYDQAGNFNTITSSPFYLDNAPPLGSVNIVKSYTNVTDIQVDFSASHATDPIEKGPIDMAYSIDDGEWSAWEPFVASKTLSIDAEGIREGTHKVSVKYRDEPGNESSVFTDTVVYDITPPECDNILYSTTSWTNQPVRATAQLSDNLCAVGEIVVINNNGTTYEFQENGSFTFEFEDAAGNRNTATATVQNIERVKPGIWLFPDDGCSQKKRSVTASVYASDNITAPENLNISYQWSMDNIHAPDSWVRTEAGSEVAKADGDGLWYLWVRAIDEAGNENLYTSRAFVLDNTPPVGTITYDPDKRTAGRVTAYLSVNEQVTVTAPAGDVREYTFTENGTFTFEFVDEVGLTGSATAVVDFIDTSLPTYHVAYSPTGWTNRPVLVTVDVSGSPPREVYGFASDVIPELVSVTKNEEGSVTQAVYQFTENGRLDFMVRDADTGLEAPGSASVWNIDTIMPGYTLVYSPSRPSTGWTNKNVTVTIIAQDDDGSAVEILDAQGQAISNAYEFAQNGTYTFYLKDKAGNILPVPAVVDYIDKIPPEAIVTYSNNGQWTNQDVTATVTFANETQPVTITNNGGSNVYTFTQNGDFTFFFKDIAGNEGQVTASVDKIDRKSPVGEISYEGFNFKWTNSDVKVKLIASDENNGPITITNNNGSPFYTFTQNGEFTFEFSDEAGNTARATAVMSRIDKDPPRAEVQYSTNTKTNATVRASVVADEPVTFTNNGGSSTYDFTDNGQFIFEMMDRAGNARSATASVDWIDKTPPVPTLTYKPTGLTKEDVVVTVGADEKFVVLNNARKTQRVFAENGTFTFYIQDEAGNVAEAKAEVNNIDKTKANITLEYSETAPTKNNVTVTIKADRPVTVQNRDGIDKDGNSYVLFTQNGSRWIDIIDDLGNETEVRIDVENIDREGPVIRFLEGERLLVEKGGQVQPLSDVSATDNLDGDMLSKVVVTHHIDPDKTGEYDVTYTVADSAGNTTTVIRKADVVPAGEFAVFINSRLPENGEVLTEGSSIGVKVFGAKGRVTMKWAEGKRKEGEFKMIDNMISNGNLRVSRSGYYTVFVQDQERQTELIYVYVVYK